MTTGKTTKPASKPFNAASYLRDDEGIAEYIVAMLDGEDARLIPTTLRTVADAVGMSELARRTGLDRSNLYTALSEGGNPRLETIVAIAGSFGLEVTLCPVRRKARKKSVEKPRKVARQVAAHA